jgi:hypothetical protein
MIRIPISAEHITRQYLHRNNTPQTMTKAKGKARWTLRPRCARRPSFNVQIYPMFAVTFARGGTYWTEEINTIAAHQSDNSQRPRPKALNNYFFWARRFSSAIAFKRFHLIESLISKELASPPVMRSISLCTARLCLISSGVNEGNGFP